MRLITSGCTARRACSTLLRDRPLADFSGISALAACAGRKTLAVAGWAALRSAASIGDTSSEDALDSSDGAGSATTTSTGAAATGVLKLVAGRIGRRTSAT